ncbi:hypothetical protein [Streptomyces sp. KL118A]|uniref:hypothetical protein n=1 Tax=Streptomyces sp. KL118A TaxID=3045153 RepID=UPI00278C482E|nr:hypothetical protein [Streptomyces sp. KL118A]
MDEATQRVLTVLGMISLVSWAARPLAAEVEELLVAWVGMFQRLRDQVRRGRHQHDDDRTD